MNDSQIFQMLGITFFAIGVGMLTNPNFIKEISKDFLGSTTSVFYGGLACLAIGFPLVTFYNVWAYDASVIITLIGWLAMVKGLALLMFPKQTTSMYKGVLVKENRAYISYVILALGVTLSYLGFLA